MTAAWMPSQILTGGSRRGAAIASPMLPISSERTIVRSSGDFFRRASNRRLSRAPRVPSTYAAASSALVIGSGIVFPQNLPHGHQPAADARLDRAERIAGGARDLLVSPAPEEGQLQSAPLRFGQLLERRGT